MSASFLKRIRYLIVSSFLEVYESRPVPPLRASNKERARRAVCLRSPASAHSTSVVRMIEAEAERAGLPRVNPFLSSEK